jgi:hypothetical protein
MSAGDFLAISEVVQILCRRGASLDSEVRLRLSNDVVSLHLKIYRAREMWSLNLPSATTIIEEMA